MELVVALILIWTVGILFYNVKQMRWKKKCTPKFDQAFDCEWNPEPLIDESHDSTSISKIVTVDSKIGKYVDINGHRLLNFASHNYLGLLENTHIEDEAKNAISKYGVGSCGPRGFYGTVDVHLTLEERIAKFLNVENAILYSSGFVTISSAVAAYVKKNDVIFADERVNFAMQRGIDATRSRVYYFKHNDMLDLEKQILQYEDYEKKHLKKSSKVRKFLLVEGIYLNTGKMCPLNKIVEIRKKYKLRLFLDESLSFGVVGKTGRGLLEHFNLNNDEVDMMMVSMEYALGSCGGFCAGSTYIIHHQRLAGLGYCFSASLPAFLAVAARVALDIIESNPSIIADLKNRCQKLHTLLWSSNLPNYFEILADSCSPVKHLSLKHGAGSLSYTDQMRKLNEIVDHCHSDGILITTASYLIEKEHFPPTPSIRLTVNSTMNEEDMMKLINALDRATTVLNYLLVKNKIC